MPRPSFIVRQNPLVYPAGVAPGFDPSHPFAGSIVAGNGYTAVCNGLGWIDPRSGKQWTNGGSPTRKIISQIGPTIGYANNGDNSSLGSQSTSAPTGGVTMAAIFQLTSNSGAFQILHQNCTGAGAQSFLINSSTFLDFYQGNTHPDSGFAPVANVPYFAVASTYGNNLGINYAITNLANGAITTIFKSWSTGALVSAGMGTCYIGANSSGTIQPTKGNIAAVMYASKFYPMAALAQWAADPWSFWYPRRSPIVLVGSGALFKFRRTLSFLGTRTASRQSA